MSSVFSRFSILWFFFPLIFLLSLLLHVFASCHVFAKVWSMQRFLSRLESMRHLHQEVSKRDQPWGQSIPVNLSGCTESKDWFEAWCPRVAWGTISCFVSDIGGLVMPTD